MRYILNRIEQHFSIAAFDLISYINKSSYQETSKYQKQLYIHDVRHEGIFVAKPDSVIAMKSLALSAILN